jgi:uncharacterized membrane protein (DUF2068 family)
LLTASQSIAPLFSLEPSKVYGVYTIAFGFGAVILGYGIWLRRNWGTLGTVGLSMFVVAVDSLAVLDLPTIPGVPKFAAFAEIAYGIIISAYLIQFKISTKWKQSA